MYIKFDPQHRIRFELGEVEFDFSRPNICYGGKGGGGTNTVTQSAPPAPVMQAYQTALNAGQGAASQPLQQYGGPTIAGFTPSQTSAFNTIDSVQGMAQPYFNSAQQAITAGTQPLWGGVQQFSPQAIQQYSNPYQQQVIGSTMAQLNQNDAIQQQQLKGNAISAGAFGGDRAGVASAVLSGQQDLANNQTIAGLNSQNYQQALGEFNTQQQAQLGANEANSYLNEQAGFGLGNLGTSAENTALTGASAQEAAGAIQQQLGQAALNVPYEQFQQQQAYPFQTAQYFANIAEGLGAQSGGLGSSTTTPPAPSAASTAAGFGLGGLGLYGASQSLGSAAADTSSAAARGGSIKAPKRYAFGGLTLGPSMGPSIGASSGIPDLSMSYVPSPMGTGSSGGHGAGGPPQAQSSTTKTPSQSQPPNGLELKGAAKLLNKSGLFNSAPAGPGNAFSGASGATDTLNTQNFLAGNNGTDFASTVNSSDPNAVFGASTDATGGGGGLLSAPSAAGGLGGDVSSAGGAFNAAGSSAATGAGAAASGAADSTIATGALDTLGAGSTLGVVDGASAAAAIDSAAADALGSVAGESVADLAPLLLLANRGGGVHGHYDQGGLVGGQTPMNASMATTGPTAQTYNSSYQNMTPEQLQQIMMRLPAGSQQQKSAQAVLQQKRMMPNVGTAPQGGFQQPQALVGLASQQQAAPQQQQPQSFDDGGDTDTDALPSATPAQPQGYTQGKVDPWLSLAAAGFGMMGGTSPYAGVNIGKGALEGVKNYDEQRKEAQAETYQSGELGVRQQEAKARAQQLAVMAENMKSESAQRLAEQKHMNNQDALAQANFDRGKSVPIVDMMGNHHIFNTSTNSFVPTGDNDVPTVSPTGNPISKDVMTLSQKQLEDRDKTYLPGAASQSDELTKNLSNIFGRYSLDAGSDTKSNANRYSSMVGLDFSGNGSSVMSPDDYKNAMAGIGNLKSAAMNGAKNVRNQREFTAITSPAELFGGGDLSPQSQLAVLNGAAHSAEAEHMFNHAYYDKYHTLDGADTVWNQYNQDNDIVKRDEQGNPVAANRDYYNPGNIMGYVNNAPTIYQKAIGGKQGVPAKQLGPVQGGAPERDNGAGGIPVNGPNPNGAAAPPTPQAIVDELRKRGVVQ